MVRELKFTANTKCYRTKADEYVRSQGEMLIHDFLSQKNIMFYYDKWMPLDIKDYKGRLKKQWVKPDFRFKDKNVVIEFWGMYGVERYNKIMKKKKKWYKEAGVNLIEIYPKELKSLEIILTIKLLQSGII